MIAKWHPAGSSAANKHTNVIVLPDLHVFSLHDKSTGCCLLVPVM
jgi:hypothetical protein